MLLTVRDAARRLNVSVGCVYSMIAAKQLPHHRVGTGRGRIRIREVDLDAYLARRRVEIIERNAQPPPNPLRRLRHLRA